MSLIVAFSRVKVDNMWVSFMLNVSRDRSVTLVSCKSHCIGWNVKRNEFRNFLLADFWRGTRAIPILKKDSWLDLLAHKRKNKLISGLNSLQLFDSFHPESFARHLCLLRDILCKLLSKRWKVTATNAQTFLNLKSTTIRLVPRCENFTFEN